MRPIPAPRIGDAHGLLRAIDQRGRLRTDEFVTEFPLDQLFPPDLENALGRMRHFISYARSAGLVKEDRGIVELTDVGRRYVRAGDPAAPYDVSAQQAEWLRRQLRERHMTDSIFHGLAIGLSLLASLPLDRRVSTLDFGRSLAYLGRAGWDNENTFAIQGERYLVLLTELELIDADHRLTATGEQVRGELTLPVHMSLLDIAAQLHPGGAEAVRLDAEAEWSPTEPPATYHDVGPGAWSPAPPAASNGEAALPAANAAGPLAEGPVRDGREAVEGTQGPVGDGRTAHEGTPEPVGDPNAAEEAQEPVGDAWEAVEGTQGPVGDGRAAGGEAQGPVGDPNAVEATPGPIGDEREAGEETGEPSRAGEATRAIPSVRPPIVPRASDPGWPGPEAPAAGPAAPPTPKPPSAGPAAPPGVESKPPSAGPAAPPGAAPVAPSEAPAPPSRVEPEAPSEAPAPPPGAVPKAPAAAPAPPGVDTPTAISPVGAAPDRPAPAEVATAPGDLNAGREAASSGGLRSVVDGFLDPVAIRAAAEAAGLRLPDGVYAGIAAALGNGKHLLLVGAPGAGKTALALAVARAAAQAGRARGATLLTARHRWQDEALLVESGKQGRWVIVDELDRARLDRALGPLSSFLAGLPARLPGGDEVKPDRAWRLVATAQAVPRGSAALLRRFATVEVPPPPRDALEAALRAAAQGDPTALAAAERLLALADVAPLGAGVFLDAARHAAARHAAAPADAATLAREAYDAYLAPLLGDLDDEARRRVRAALDAS
jgi:MoxR-like ATPase